MPAVAPKSETEGEQNEKKYPPTWGIEMQHGLGLSLLGKHGAAHIDHLTADVAAQV